MRGGLRGPDHGRVLSRERIGVDGAVLRLVRISGSRSGSQPTARTDTGLAGTPYGAKGGCKAPFGVAPISSASVFLETLGRSSFNQFVAVIWHPYAPVHQASARLADATKVEHDTGATRGF